MTIIPTDDAHIVPQTPIRPTVSHSEVDSYLRCRRAWYYGYALNLQRVQTSNSLRRGTLGHLALEHFFRTLEHGGSFDDAKVAAQTAINDEVTSDPTIFQLGLEVMECLGYFYEAYPFEGWTVLAVEKEFLLPIYEGLDFPLVVDLIIQDKWGLVWVIDHKFMWDFLTDDDAELQSQIPKYIGALRASGFKVDRAGYNILRYRSMKDNSVENRYRFVPLYDLTDLRVQTTFREHAITAKQIQEIKALPVEQQNWLSIRIQNKLVCKSCSFKEICIAELNDRSPALVIDASYQQRERREFKTIEIEATDE